VRDKESCGVFVRFSLRALMNTKSVGAWHKDIVAFNLPELDSTKRYDLFINVRDNNDYQFNNLFFNCGVGITNGFTK
jgi:hypothetical protein